MSQATRHSHARLRLLFCSLSALLWVYLIAQAAGCLPDTERVEEEASKPAPFLRVRHPKAVDDVPGRMSLAPQGEKEENIQTP
jgi:hypothetical protein